jgi:hypothetical protein
MVFAGKPQSIHKRQTGSQATMLFSATLLGGVLASVPNPLALRLGVPAAMIAAAGALYRSARRKRLECWAEGMVLVDGERREIPWEAVEHYMVFSTGQVEALVNGQRPLSLHGWTDEHALLLRFLGEVNARMVERARKAIAAGETVRYGGFSVSKAGVAYDQQPPVPFGAVTRFDVHKGRLLLGEHGKHDPVASVAAQAVPSLDALLELVEQLRKSPS